MCTCAHRFANFLHPNNPKKGKIYVSLSKHLGSVYTEKRKKRYSNNCATPNTRFLETSSTPTPVENRTRNGPGYSFHGFGRSDPELRAGASHFWAIKKKRKKESARKKGIKSESYRKSGTKSQSQREANRKRSRAKPSQACNRGQTDGEVREWRTADAPPPFPLQTNKPRNIATTDTRQTLENTGVEEAENGERG